MVSRGFRTVRMNLHSGKTAAQVAPNRLKYISPLSPKIGLSEIHFLQPSSKWRMFLGVILSCLVYLTANQSSGDMNSFEPRMVISKGRVWCSFPQYTSRWLLRMWVATVLPVRGKLTRKNQSPALGGFWLVESNSQTARVSSSCQQTEVVTGVLQSQINPS